MAYGLDAMTVRIEREGAVVVGVVVRSQSGRTVVAPAFGQRCGVKAVDRRPIGRAEAKMRAAYGRSDVGFARDGEFHPERARRCAVVGAAAVAEIDDAHEPERTQCSVVETAATADVADAERDVIEHRVIRFTKATKHGSSRRASVSRPRSFIPC